MTPYQPRSTLFPYTTLFRSVFRPERNGMDDPRLWRDCREKHSKILREAHRYRSNRPRLNHQKKRPAVKKSPQRRIGFAQIHVLTACVRKKSGEFAIGKGRGNGKQARENPRK